MKIDIGENGIYQILKIEDDLKIISDLSELRFLIRGYLNQGKRYIAVSFTGASYIYSGAIAVLVDCYKRIKNENGILCIVESHPQILSIFEFLHLNKVIPIFKTIDELPDPNDMEQRK